MKRRALALALLLVVPSAGAAQGSTPRPVNANSTAAEKIANAQTAAPATISAQATILDWPASEGASFRVLRNGTNGWSCLPDFPPTEGNDPMCLDEQWLKFVQAQLTNARPQVTRVGLGYMIAPGGAQGSSSDPQATAPSADNHWGHDGPHLMMIVPDTRTLQGLPTTRDSGGPYVMFAGTPYAHLMIPIDATTSARRH